MPTYEYQCSSCNHEFELFQSITAKPVKKCPACKRATAKRLISAGASIIFKGSGFYETDYRSDSYKKAAKADADAAGGGKSEKSDKAAESSKSDGGKAKAAASDTASKKSTSASDDG